MTVLVNCRFCLPSFRAITDLPLSPLKKELKVSIKKPPFSGGLCGGACRTCTYNTFRCDRLAIRSNTIMRTLHIFPVDFFVMIAYNVN